MSPVQTTSPTGTVLTAEAVAALPLEPLGSLVGVKHRVLWRTGESEAGVMTVEGGHHLGSHAHRENHHHMWIIDGAARILGTDVASGAYVHIPAGVDHDIDATGTTGCTLFYLYLHGVE